jgi:hypothetical protein
MENKSAVGEFIKDTPQWAKGVIALAAIGGGFLLYRGITKGIKKKADEAKGIKPSSSSELPANISTDIKEQAKKTPLSYRLSVYDTYAQDLYGAMYRAFTEEDTIYRIMGYMKNDADVLQLIKAFGVRPAGAGQFWLGNATLNEWFSDELDSRELGIVNKILASKKNPSITYRF